MWFQLFLDSTATSTCNWDALSRILWNIIIAVHYWSKIYEEDFKNKEGLFTQTLVTSLPL
jgi:hypothetical protein